MTLTNNDVVTNDNYGITVKNASNPDDIVRIVSGGIVLSNDGGATYTTGIYAG
nr:MAG TPA: minor structural protein [Caudoviricetes sp.]